MPLGLCSAPPPVRPEAVALLPVKGDHGLEGGSHMRGLKAPLETNISKSVNKILVRSVAEKGTVSADTVHIAINGSTPELG